MAAEDDEGELHRRGRTLLKYLDQTNDKKVDRELLSHRLHIVSRVAEDNLLTKTNTNGEVYRTVLVDRIVKSALAIPDLRMIVFDPVSRFRGGRANWEEDATRFVEALEAVREQTGATVLALSHVSKAGMKEGGESEIVRGSTALVDGVRWVATLQPLPRKDADKYSVKPEDARMYVRLEIPKSNYTAPYAGLWLHREAGGVMVPVELEEVIDGKKEAKADRRYMDVVERLQGLLKEKGPMTRRYIRLNHAGKFGMLRIGEKSLRGIMNRAVHEEWLIERPGKNGVELHVPEEDE